MIETMQRCAARHGIELGPVIDKPDAVIRRIVDSWPIGTDATRAINLGLPDEKPLEEVIEDYITDYLKN